MILLYCILGIIVFNSVSCCKANRFSPRSWVRLGSIWRGAVHMGKWGRNQPGLTWAMDVVGRWFSMGLRVSMFYGWRHWMFFFLSFHWSLCVRMLWNIMIVCCPWIEYRVDQECRDLSFHGKVHVDRLDDPLRHWVLYAQGRKAVIQTDCMCSIYV